MARLLGTGLHGDASGRTRSPTTCAAVGPMPASSRRSSARSVRPIDEAYERAGWPSTRLAGHVMGQPSNGAAPGATVAIGVLEMSRRRRTLPIPTCLSALATDRAMETWYDPSIA